MFQRASLRMYLGALSLASCALSARAQITLVGPGGMFPTSSSGMDAPYPHTGQAAPPALPSFAFLTTVTVPAAMTKITKVRILGFMHTYVGDAHFVLLSPTGARYNVMTPPNIFNSAMYGNSCSINADFDFVDPARPGSGTFPPDSSAICSSEFLSGTYPQYFGAGSGSWPPLNGNTQPALGVLNTPLESIPVTPGTWTLECYDWYLSGDNGTFTSWELIGLGAVGPVTYCTAGTSVAACDASLAVSAQPSVTQANPCAVSLANVDGQRAAIVFYGLAPLAQSWCVAGGSSFLCVKAPLERLPAQDSGGTFGVCDGQVTLDWHAFQVANSPALGQPWAVGAQVYVQCWLRDSLSCKLSILSNAAELTYVP